MKWYSVKKHKPLRGFECLVVTENNDLWLAKWGIGLDDDEVWVSSYDEDIIVSITHFCIPSPVEIEE